jgi:hypothetical protein
MVPADTLTLRIPEAVKKEKPDLTKKVHDVPHKPGVYLMRDRFNRVIYVGKARDLRKRVSSYFLPSKLAVADLKTRAMLDAVWDFETHVVRSEAESVLLEGKLIKEYRPRYNISFRDDKRFLLVKVDLSEEWPRFRLARFKKDDAARYFGPYARRSIAPNIELHAQKIRRAHVWARRANGTGIEVINLPGPGASPRNRQRAVSNAGGRRHGVFGGTFARDDWGA